MSASGDVAEPMEPGVNDTGEAAVRPDKADDACTATSAPTETAADSEQSTDDNGSSVQTVSRTLYVVSLPSSCDQLLIESLFEPDEIESMKFSSESSVGGSGIVVSVLFKSDEIANQALEVDGFEIDDGEEKTRIKVLTPEKYVAYLKSMETKQPLEEVRTAPISDSEEGGEEGAGTDGVVAETDENGDGGDTNAQPAHSQTEPNTLPTPRDTDKPQIEPVSDDEAETLIPHSSSSPSNSQPPPPTTEEIDDIYVGKRISEYMVANRVNWANVDCVDDVWGICDAISASHGGLPDSLLKEAFLLVIQSNLHQHNSNVWVRQHLQRLLKDWKREVHSTKASNRPTKFVAAPALYTPIGAGEAADGEGDDNATPTSAVAATTQQDDQQTAQPGKKKKRQRLSAKRRKALATLMGVGEILQQARVKFATEDGELQVDEDEYGNISIGGQELTFDSWATLNKIKEDGVVRCAPPAKQKRLKQRHTDLFTRLLPRLQFRTLPASNSQSSAQQPPPTRTARNDANGSGKLKEPNAKKAKLPKPKAEKDEGELSESEEEELGGGASSSATSSSDDGSNDEEEADGGGTSKSRRRRKKRRHNERQAAPSSIANMGSVFSKFYQHRFQIARSLTLQQKALLLDALKQSSSSGNSAQQSQMMMAFMAAFMSSSLAQQSPAASS